MAVARKNTKSTVVVETVAPEAVVVVEAPATEAPVAEVEEATGPQISVAIAPCGYVSQRVNLGSFAVAYTVPTGNARQQGGMVAGVFSTEAAAQRAADRVNETSVGINPKDLGCRNALVLPAYVIRKSQMAEARSTLVWLYAAWLEAEAAFLNDQVRAKASA